MPVVLLCAFFVFFFFCLKKFFFLCQWSKNFWCFRVFVVKKIFFNFASQVYFGFRDFNSWNNSMIHNSWITTLYSFFFYNNVSYIEWRPSVSIINNLIIDTWIEILYIRQTRIKATKNSPAMLEPKNFQMAK